MNNHFLLKLLRERSYEKREVTLTSGLKSDFYIDCKKTFMTQPGLVLCAEALLHKLRAAVTDEGWDPCKYVAGGGVGGGPLAAAMVIAAHHNGNTLDMLYVRNEAKEHGSQHRVEPAISPTPNRNVVLVEDVITTGGSAIRAMQVLRADGWNVQGVLALVDREEGGAANINAAGFAIGALFTKTEIVEDFLHSKGPVQVGLFVNGREHLVVPGQYISYEEVVDWQVQAGGRRGLYSVVWTSGERSGMISPGQGISINDNTHVTAVITDNA